MREPPAPSCFPMLPVFYHPLYSSLALPAGHRFPLQKYQALYHALRSYPVDIRTAQPATLAQLLRVHEPQYVEGLRCGTLPTPMLRRIGFPWSHQLIDRTLHSVGATIEAARMACQQGCALQISGGYHHAHYAMGSGFCLLNDLVIAAQAMLDEARCSQVLIIDLDVHQGDGSASLCAGRRDIITLSLHAERNFPSRKCDSHLDVALPDGMDDRGYLETLDEALAVAFRLCSPDLILYQAGVDIHQGDELGYLAISSQGIRLRDRAVLMAAKTRGIPIACVAGGGYRRDWQALIALHLMLFEEANACFG